MAQASTDIRLTSALGPTVTVRLTAQDFRRLRRALWAVASEPDWNLGMAVLDRIETDAHMQLNSIDSRAFAEVQR